METPEKRSVVAIGLGANLGDRRSQLERALEELDALPETELRAVSGLYRTEPRIVEDQPEFLNACATIETALEPRKLLDALLQIEREFGRRRSRDKGPRRLDLDILLWEQRILESDGLTVPHPGVPDRAFVLRPLADIAPKARDPRSGRTIVELLDRCGDDGDIEEIDW